MSRPFNKDFAPEPPVLSQLMEGRPIARQNSRLLNLPDEILSIIITYIYTDREALASIALVNSACRQLARSCQFCSISLDYSHRTSCVLGVLIHEAAERHRSKNGLTRRPSLGACVRRIQMDSTPTNFELSTTSGMNQWREWVGKMTTIIRHIYHPSLKLVIYSLPYLGIANWASGSFIDNHLLNSLTNSKVKHLKLHGSVDFDHLADECGDKTEWPLLTLDIDIACDLHFGYGRCSTDASSLCSSFIRKSSSTLQSLKLSNKRRTNAQRPISFTAEFPRLRFLQLGYRTNVSELALRMLLRNEKLHTLVVDFSDPVTRECLDQIGSLKSLRTLIWGGINIPDTASFQVLEQNTQVMAFGIRYRSPISLLERALTVLATFPNLKTLSLIWDGTTIPGSSLAALSSLTSLENLHISSGEQYGYRHNWFIDHDVIRASLFPLRKLKSLVITRDTYSIDDTSITNDDGSYYSLRLPIIQQVQDNSSMSDERAIWEKMHHQSMAQQAEQYAAVFEALEWIRLGQFSFVFRNGTDDKRVAVSLNSEREEDFEVLENVFGIF